jgi:hypothetical protein
MQKIRDFIVCCKLFCNQRKLREDTFELLSDRALCAGSRDALNTAAGQVFPLSRRNSFRMMRSRRYKTTYMPRYITWT